MWDATPELLEADDALIDDAVGYADPLALRGVLYQLTGDEELVDVELRTLVVGGYRRMQQVARKEDVAAIRAKAAAFLRSYRDAGAGPLDIGAVDRLRRSMSLAVGFEVAPNEMEMWTEELAVDPWARGLPWVDGTPPDVAGFSVVVVGAGMGGLNAAVHLRRAGIPFTVLEKNPSVGGTWHENRYPGARVDSPSRIYTHLYGVGFLSPYPFCPQPENEKYVNWVADTFDLRSSIEFDTEVDSMVWDDRAGMWEITARHGGGSRVWRANAVISAVGLLSRPNIPRLEGIEDFAGQWFHTARWPADLDLSGKRVAVIGTGCTGYQLVPEVVKEARRTYVFQRTPNWVYQVPGYLDAYPPQVNWLDRNFPYLSHYLRLQAAYLSRPQNTLKGLQVDPDFHDEHAVSAVNKAVRDERMAFLRDKLGGRPDLLDKMTPTAPPMSARPVLVDRDYSILDVLASGDATLVTDGIGRVTERGIELTDGTRYDVDVIVLATGFRANDFLWPMEVRGREGRSLEQLWAKDGARAYIGSMLPGFPNFFLVYGPNTNMLAGLQIIAMEEVTTRFALENIGGLIEQHKTVVEVTEDAYWRYNAVVDRAERLMTYVDPRAHNYYQNAYGRSATNGPLDTRLSWNWLRDPARRLPPDRTPDVEIALAEQYEAIDPHFDADLVVR